ncbi:hypothetical protein PFFVO_00758 [Plasmodium falciparum Vietnam Oak-Knoll (FVO)]|uniref:Uncharacterized protein n=1 Tax=Plasmodium falciparum Vietnam Oak-Knoll (FVO) TaxID=1036723 RepID=A0A024VCH0_PLAFA|nr:hypothetical protein PFFVO_00758 [Plasmodium falciparum Vietnam Oak-Knoll (FVO)]
MNYCFIHIQHLIYSSTCLVKLYISRFLFYPKLHFTILKIFQNTWQIFHKKYKLFHISIIESYEYNNINIDLYYILNISLYYIFTKKINVLYDVDDYN